MCGKPAEAEAELRTGLVYQKLADENPAVSRLPYTGVEQASSAISLREDGQAGGV